MKIIFTKHALERMATRGVSEQLITQCIQMFLHHNPAVHTKETRRIVNEIGSTKLLIIICFFTTNECRILTAYFTSKVQKYFYLIEDYE